MNARLDLYDGPHKALRAFMFDTLQRLGRTDLGDAADRDAALAQVDALLRQCRRHLAREDEFLHRAIEARSPTSSGRLADEHRLHVDMIDSLDEQLTLLCRAEAAARTAHAARLYGELALFIAENLQHMQREQSEHNRVLWALYSDAELETIQQAWLAAAPPDERALMLRWMTAAFAPAELARLRAPGDRMAGYRPD